MIINLHEIPEEGRSWTINRQTSELNEILRDLIGNVNYQAEFSIVPSSPAGTYMLQGWMKTELPEQCSRCGIDFQYAIDQKFTHILLPSFNPPRDAKFVKPNHFTDMEETSTEAVEYFGHRFNVGDFFHELIALTEPLSPAPPADANDDCSVCKISLKNHSFSYEESMEIKNTPFVSLKGVKLN